MHAYDIPIAAAALALSVLFNNRNNCYFYFALAAADALLFLCAATLFPLFISNVHICLTFFACCCCCCCFRISMELLCARFGCCLLLIYTRIHCNLLIFSKCARIEHQNERNESNTHTIVGKNTLYSSFRQAQFTRAKQFNGNFLNAVVSNDHLISSVSHPQKHHAFLPINWQREYSSRFVCCRRFFLCIC